MVSLCSPKVLGIISMSCHNWLVLKELIKSEPLIPLTGTTRILAVQLWFTAIEIFYRNPKRASLESPPVDLISEVRIRMLLALLIHYKAVFKSQG